MRFLLPLLFLAQLLGQQQDVITFNAANPAPVSVISTSVSGTAGSVTYYYWVVARYPIGLVQPLTYGVVNNAPSTLNGSNFDQISFNLVPGATSYDLLRTNTPSFPGSCTCAVSTGNTSSPINDQSNTLSSYSFTSVVGSTAILRLNNRDFSSPRLEWSIGGGTFGPLPASSGGTSIPGAQAASNGGDIPFYCFPFTGLLCTDPGNFTYSHSTPPNTLSAPAIKTSGVLSQVNSFSAQADVPSASTIAITTGIVRVSGTATIHNITPPGSFNTGGGVNGTGGVILIVPTGGWSTATDGNIINAITASANVPVVAVYFSAVSAWYLK